MDKKLHIVMFPWFAIGHMTPFLHLANELAKRGHKTTFLLPNKAKLLFESSNLHPSLITLRPIPVPHVEPLPPGTETASDIPLHLNSHLATALDLTRPYVESAIVNVMSVDVIFYDFAWWVPEIAAKYGIKSVCYPVVCVASIAIVLVPGHNPTQDEKNSVRIPPPGYPSKTIVLRDHEAKGLQFFVGLEFGRGVTFYERNIKAMSSCDAIATRTIKEFEGSFCDYLANQYKKPVFLTGPILPNLGSNKEELDPKWSEWLGRFGPGSVVFCALGSQIILEKDQFQELLLGFEMTKFPFLVAVKPPTGCVTIDEALPEGFKERVGEGGVVHGGWVPQPQILGHSSIGCFVNHCGFGSMWESLLSGCQIVLVPQLGDQILNTRLMAEELKVGVEVKKESNGWVSKESLYNAIKNVMDDGSLVGDLVRKNHEKWRKILVSPNFMSGYIDNFIKNLQGLLS